MLFQQVTLYTMYIAYIYQLVQFRDESVMLDTSMMDPC